MIRIFLFILPLLFLFGCINLREPYPKIEYYNLVQEESLLKGLPSKEPVVMVRRVQVNESYDTPHLLVYSEANSVRRLYYHRWISDISTISTDFFITRINKSGLLKQGIVRSGSIAIPDYIIEPQLIDMTAFDSQQKGGECYVNVEFKVSILKRKPDNNLEVLFSSVYKQKFVRRKKDIKYIPEAYSKVFSLAVDNIIADMSNVIQ